jgi:DNA-binding transcriptional regulator LsrR (DeoR family)
VTYLDSKITAGSSIGLGGGATHWEVVSHLSPRGPADVVQLAGGFVSSAGNFNGNQLVVSASAILDGNPYLRHAPALVSSPEARALRRDHPPGGRRDGSDREPAGAGAAARLTGW